MKKPWSAVAWYRFVTGRNKFSVKVFLARLPGRSLTKLRLAAALQGTARTCDATTLECGTLTNYPQHWLTNEKIPDNFINLGITGQILPQLDVLRFI